MNPDQRRQFRFPWRTALNIDRDVEAELQLHLDLRTAALVETGLSEGAAREAALREFGDLDYTRRYCRDQDAGAERAARWRDRLDGLAGNVAYALRSFRRAPGFTVTAILTLALAIGANTAIFSVANAVLIAPLPFGEPGRLVAVFEHKVRDNIERSDMSAADLIDYRTMQRSLSGIGILTNTPAIVRDGETDPVAAQALRVSTNMFDVLQAQPRRGRTFTPDEDNPGKRQVAVLSATFAQRLFGGDSLAVGRTVAINDEPHLIIGVMPAGFGLGYREDIYLPLDLGPQLADVNRARKMHYLYAVGRLRPGVAFETARADLNSVAATLESRYPDVNAGHLVTVLPLQVAMAGDARAAAFILVAASALVLLVACANLGNLMLARAVARRREMVVRAAIGASRAHLVRQLLVESMVLAAAGGAAGIALGAAAIPLIVRAGAGALPASANVTMDWRVLAASLTASVVVGCLIGLVPALGASHLDLNRALKESSRAAAGDRKGVGLRKALVILQVATATVLLVVAGLLVRSFEALRTTNLGFQPDHALTMSVAVRGPRYRSKAGLNQFYDGLFTQLRTSSGINAVGAVSGVPLLGSSGCGLAIEDQPYPPDQMPEVRCLGARGDYFKAIGTPLLTGRMWNDTDLPDGPQVAVVNAALAHAFWPGQSPLGKRIRLGPDPSQPWETIIGVVGDQRQTSIEAQPKPTAFEYDAQHGWGSLGIVVRTSGDPIGAAPLLRAAVRQVDPALAVRSVWTLDEVVGLSLAARRFSLGLIGGFGFLALVLAVVGLYGVLAYFVASRTREFGIRMALGADTSTVLASVLGRGLAWTVGGVAIGAAGALAAARALRTMFYGVPPDDPITFLIVTLVFISVAALACVVPATQATGIDPLSALRGD